MLRHAAVVGAASTSAGALVAGVVAAPSLPAAGSALLAGAVVTVSMTSGLAAVRWLLAQQDAVIMPGALAILLVVAVLLIAVALVLGELAWIHRPAFAFTALGAAVLIQAALVRAYLTGPRPLLDVAMPGREA